MKTGSSRRAESAAKMFLTDRRVLPVGHEVMLPAATAERPTSWPGRDFACLRFSRRGSVVATASVPGRWRGLRTNQNKRRLRRRRP